MKIIFIIVALFALKSFAAESSSAKILDPKGLLPEVAHFIKSNTPLENKQSVLYQPLNYKIQCNGKKCEALSAPRDGSDCLLNGSIATENCAVLSWHVEGDSVYWDKDFGYSGYQIFPNKTPHLQDPIEALTTALALIVESPTRRSSPYPYNPEDQWPIYGYGDVPYFKNFSLEKLTAETYESADGKLISALRVQGSLIFPVSDFIKRGDIFHRPVINTYDVSLPVEIWLGRDVTQVEQVLKVTLAGKPIHRVLLRLP